MVTFCKGRYCLAFALWLMPLLSLIAQQHTYSLQTLIDTAKQHWPTLLQKQANIDAVKASLTDVKHSFLPQIRFNDQINIGSDNSIAGSYFPMGIIPSTSAGVSSRV